MVWLNRSVNDCAVARSARDKTRVAPRLLSEVPMNPQSTVRAALRQPLFWVALVVLLLNDHVLKGAGVLPDWLTGKLSDFAGLVVAPLVLTALLRGRRAWAFVAVGGWFIAVNLVPEAARASEAAMGLLGISWRLWTDPTDLVALAAMPIAWTMTERGETRVRRRGLEHAAMLLGAFACMATSREPEPVGRTEPIPAPPPSSVVSLENQSGGPLDVRVRWVEGELDCDAVANDLGRALPRDAFGTGVTYRMEQGSFATLVRNEGRGQNCEAALVQSTSFEERILFWRPSQIGFSGEQLIVSRGSMTIPDVVATAIPQEAIATAYCPEREASELYGWTGLGPGHQRQGLLTNVEETIDGCLELTLDDTEVLFLCVPPASFPFELGDELYLDEEADGAGRHLLVNRVIGMPGEPVLPMRRLDVYTGSNTDVLGGLVSVYVQHTSGLCGGDRLDCGAYRIAGALEVNTTFGPMRLAPGENITLDVDDTVRMDIHLGRAEHIAFTRPECGVERDSVGSHIDAVVTYREEIE